MSDDKDALRKMIEQEAQEYFTAYFVQNYPGPNTIISNPNWHAPKIFRAALWAMQQAQKDNLVRENLEIISPSQVEGT